MAGPAGLGFALRVSRFRFWIYTGGTYVVGFALGASALEDFLDPWYYVYLLYFFFPANLFIYGVNDYWDEETDRRNPKKDGKEMRLTSQQRRSLVLTIYAVLGLSLALMVLEDWTERAILSSFLLLSYFYSAPPLRFKGVPFLDSASNFLYVLPGVFAYYLASGELPGPLLLLGGFAHVYAMHLFSAIPDIEYDRAAGIRTGAVLLGSRASLVLCAFWWSVLAIIAFYLSGGHPLSLLALVYPSFPIALLLLPSLDINRAYWLLPYVNTFLGGVLWVALVWSALA
ncbi:MAG: prenyltransferase [Methanomassiliicoccales archaeon]|nr:prenyltransferase [Methanomassiliicoccales archaeon]